MVLTNGVFDLLHCGHANYLERARALGESLVVAVNDASDIVRCVRPDWYVKGGDYDLAQTPEGRLARALGACVMAIPIVHYTSTTALVNRIIGSGSRAGI